MTFAWASAGRLRPMRMVWLERNYNDPKYELVKWRQPSLRTVPRMEWARLPKVEDDRESRQRFPGKTGEWPRNRRQKRKAKP